MHKKLVGNVDILRNSYEKKLCLLLRFPQHSFFNEGVEEKHKIINAYQNYHFRLTIYFASTKS